MLDYDTERELQMIGILPANVVIKEDLENDVRFIHLAKDYYGNAYNDKGEIAF